MLNQSDHATLIIELQKPIYGGLEDVEAATLLEALSATQGQKLVKTADLLDALISTGVYKILKSKKATDGDASTILDVLLNPNIGDEIDLSRPSSIGMLAVMLSRGIITSSQKTAIEAMGKCPMTLAEELLGQGKTIHHLDVARARGRGN